MDMQEEDDSGEDDLDGDNGEHGQESDGEDDGSDYNGGDDTDENSDSVLTTTETVMVETYHVEDGPLAKIPDIYKPTVDMAITLPTMIDTRCTLFRPLPLYIKVKKSRCTFVFCFC